MPFHLGQELARKFKPVLVVSRVNEGVRQVRRFELEKLQKHNLLVYSSPRSTYASKKDDYWKLEHIEVSSRPAPRGLRKFIGEAQQVGIGVDKPVWTTRLTRARKKSPFVIFKPKSGEPLDLGVWEKFALGMASQRVNRMIEAENSIRVARLRDPDNISGLTPIPGTFRALGLAVERTRIK